ncbi:hypothetical protein EVAR_84459_1 [Eumeta japonica]|uniref:Uncharacterized protein n=1 Tax=Eumeta variegata TaxID=151549 RepID=A0A4C1XC57_EUMVA|nr:hypothetical protein EVAR_84459_1 [Eumeta japonica]
MFVDSESGSEIETKGRRMYSFLLIYAGDAQRVELSCCTILVTVLFLMVFLPDFEPDHAIDSNTCSVLGLDLGFVHDLNAGLCCSPSRLQFRYRHR